MADELTPPGVQPTAAATQAGSAPQPTQSYGPPPPMPHPAGPPAPGQYWTPPPPVSPVVFGESRRRGNGLAITAVVLSAVALLVALGVAAALLFGGSGGPAGALSGQVTPVDHGVASNNLQAELTKIITDDGGSVDTITCPDRSAVGQGLVTVCKGSVDGYDWTGIVVFEDAEGTFVLNEL